MPTAAVAFPGVTRAPNPMVREESVLERHNVATTGTEEPFYDLYPVCREKLCVSDLLILRTKRQLASSAPEGRNYDRRGNLGPQSKRFEFAHPRRKQLGFHI